MELKNLTEQIIHNLNELVYDEFALGDQQHQEQSKNKVQLLVAELSQSLDQDKKLRIQDEFFNNGPLEVLFADSEITEILLNGPTDIFYEKHGVLHQHEDIFFSNFTYENFIHRICDQTNKVLNLESPFLDASFKNFRISIIDKSITQKHTTINFRRHPLISWTFQKLLENNWCSDGQFKELETLIKDRKNFLIIGATGSGKTSVLNAMLNLLPTNERALIIEDTAEISIPNNVSLKLLTQSDPNNIRPEVSQTDLVKRALRLRPDRIVMGEIRSSEAKDFLMALSTGHLGSFGTLHANDPHQALIRLEMLIQMGAPNWSLTAIRRLIFLSLDMIIVVGKNNNSQRIFKGAYQLCSLEDNGFLLEQKF